MDMERYTEFINDTADLIKMAFDVIEEVYDRDHTRISIDVALKAVEIGLALQLQKEEEA